jgi:hypothetical protein
MPAFTDPVGAEVPLEEGWGWVDVAVDSAVAVVRMREVVAALAGVGVVRAVIGKLVIFTRIILAPMDVAQVGMVQVLSVEAGLVDQPMGAGHPSIWNLASKLWCGT